MKVERVRKYLRRSGASALDCPGCPPGCIRLRQALPDMGACAAPVLSSRWVKRHKDCRHSFAQHTYSHRTPTHSPPSRTCLHDLDASKLLSRLDQSSRKLYSREPPTFTTSARSQRLQRWRFSDQLQQRLQALPQATQARTLKCSRASSLQTASRTSNSRPPTTSLRLRAGIRRCTYMRSGRVARTASGYSSVKVTSWVLAGQR